MLLKITALREIRCIRSGTLACKWLTQRSFVYIKCLLFWLSNVSFLRLCAKPARLKLSSLRSAVGIVYIAYYLLLPRLKKQSNSVRNYEWVFFFEFIVVCDLVFLRRGENRTHFRNAHCKHSCWYSRHRNSMKIEATLILVGCTFLSGGQMHPRYYTVCIDKVIVDKQYR